MPDPYVRSAPANVGACSATWYVDPATEPVPGSDGSNPTFGQPLPNPFSGVTGAWQFLVPGPLKDVLTKEYPVAAGMEQEMLQDWAAAGGEVSIMALAGNGPVFGASARPINVVGAFLPTQQMAFGIEYDVTQYPAVPVPIRWSIRFSVPHSIVR
jgi:hypothetical protein